MSERYGDFRDDMPSELAEMVNLNDPILGRLDELDRNKHRHIRIVVYNGKNPPMAMPILGPAKRDA